MRSQARHGRSASRLPDGPPYSSRRPGRTTRQNRNRSRMRSTTTGRPKPRRAPQTSSVQRRNQQQANVPSCSPYSFDETPTNGTLDDCLGIVTAREPCPKLCCPIEAPAWTEVGCSYPSTRSRRTTMITTPMGREITSPPVGDLASPKSGSSNPIATAAAYPLPP